MSSQVPWGHFEEGTRFRLDRRALFVISYVVAFVVSKYLGFSPGYALDDYHIISAQQDGENISFFISQGRYGSALIEAALRGSGLNMASFSVVSLIASMVFSGLFFASVLSPDARTSAFTTAAAAAVLGAHSYYSEYVTFRQSALPMGMMFGLMWLSSVAYRQFRCSNQLKHAAIALLAATGAMGFNQLAVCYCASAILYMHLKETASSQIEAGACLKAAAWGTVAAAGTGALLIVANTALSALLREALSLSTDARASLLGIAQVPERGAQILSLIPQMLYRSETVASPLAKLTLLAGIAALVIPLGRKELRNSFLAIYFFSIGTAITLVPVSLSSTWWPVPRTLVSLAFVLVGTASIISADGRRRRSILAGALFTVSALLFAAHSNTVLLNQQRLNRWDMAQAQAIALRSTAQFPEASGRIALSGANWYHPLAPGIAQGDMNTSALAVGWAVDALFDEATGLDLHVRNAPDRAAICENRQPFPARDSMIDIDGEVVVCL
ncbi:hypothetical protein ACSYHF_02685 [Stenotrophomonas maltophilia group sp. P373]|uniref:hypothetical protein n=1 Tax=Stenotrophomonas sepilia TaxID=2860290 RepID=UPI002E79F74D|nr:hypothetical protein [Stenotrophomonas sepilia]